MNVTSAEPPGLRTIEERLHGHGLLGRTNSLRAACQASPNSFKKATESAFRQAETRGAEQARIGFADRYALLLACVQLAQSGDEKMAEWRQEFPIVGKQSLIAKFTRTFVVQTLQLLSSFELPAREYPRPDRSAWNLFRQRVSALLTPSETRKIGGALDYESNTGMMETSRWFRLFSTPGVDQALLDYTALLAALEAEPRRGANPAALWPLAAAGYVRATAAWLGRLEADARFSAQRLALERILAE